MIIGIETWKLQTQVWQNVQFFSSKDLLSIQFNDKTEKLPEEVNKN